MRNYDFLKDVKIGDKFGIECIYHGKRIVTVERLTKTLIITNRGRYDIRNGYSKGGDIWTKDRLLELTNKFIHQFNKEQYIKRIKNISSEELNEIPNEELKNISNILKKYKGE